MRTVFLSLAVTLGIAAPIAARTPYGGRVEMAPFDLDGKPKAKC